MIKEKLLKFLDWFKDHFLFLLEVVVRLSVGLREENKMEPKSNVSDKDQKGGQIMKQFEILVKRPDDGRFQVLTVNAEDEAQARKKVSEVYAIDSVTEIKKGDDY